MTVVELFSYFKIIMKYYTTNTFKCTHAQSHLTLYLIKLWYKLQLKLWNSSSKHGASFLQFSLSIHTFIYKMTLQRLMFTQKDWKDKSTKLRQNRLTRIRERTKRVKIKIQLKTIKIQFSAINGSNKELRNSGQLFPKLSTDEGRWSC